MAQRHTPSRVQSGPFKLKQTTLGSQGRTEHVTSSAKRPPPRRAQVAGNTKLNFSEVRGDLFDCPKTAALAHCVSEDMAMGKGIAKEFKKRFAGKTDLIDQGKIEITNSNAVPRISTGIKTGGVAVLEREGRYIFYLVY